MPSGSKRRKAAKKKKEQEAPISGSSSTNTNTHENDEVRGHDEKESDGGEPNSPVSHDHHAPFNGGSEELGKSDPLPVASADVENKPVDVPVDSDGAQKIEVDGNGEVETVKEVKFEDDSPIPIESVEPTKEQHDEGNEKSSIFRSDGESLVTEEKFGVEEGSENLKTSRFEDLEKLGESLPQELTKVIDGAPGEDVNVAETVVSLSEKVIDLTEAALSDNKADFELNSRGKEDLLPSMDEVQQVASSGLESASNNVGAKVIPVSVENSGVESGAVTLVSVENEGELLPSSGVSVAQTGNVAEKAKDLEVCESNKGLESASNNVGAKVFPVSVENSGVKSGAVTSVSKEKEGEFLPSSGISLAETHNGAEKAKGFEICESNNGLESASNNVGARVFPVSVENSGIESGAVTAVSKEKEDELLPSSGISVAQAHNSTKNTKDFEVCESSEDQPLVAPAPRIAEKTSWMSCCGLFDVCMGSSR